MPPHDPEEFEPDWSMHPGAVLRQVMEHRGIRQSELAERTGLTAKHVNQIVTEGIGISGDVALLLERALGFNAQFWTRADADHQAYVSTQKAKDKLTDYSAWAASFDAGTLRRHGITRTGDSQSAKAEKILRFFGVASPEAFEQTWQRPRVSFRRSQAFTVAEQNTALWLRLVDRSAEQVTVPRLQPTALRKVVRTIVALTNLTVPDGFIAARAALAEAGVVLTFVREVPGTRVLGATWWLGPDRPVIGLTERLRKPDIFWFNLLHEIGHVVLHPRRTTFLDLDEENAVKGPAELEADTFAEQALWADDARAHIARITTREQLLLMAATLGVGVTMVAGQHGHATGLWHVGGTLRGKITDADVEVLEKMCPAGPAERPG